MAIIRADAVVSAKDATGKTFEQIAGKIKGVVDTAKSFAGVKLPEIANPAWGKTFQDNLDRMKVSMREQVRLAREFGELQRAIHPNNFPIGAFRSHEYLGALNRWKTITLGNLKLVRAEAERVNAALSPLARGVLTTAGVIGPAYLASRGIRATAAAAANFEREDARNWLAGLSPEEQTRARAASKDFSARYQLIDEGQIQARLRNLRAFTGSLDGALGLLDNDLKALTVLQSLRGRDDAMVQFRELYRGLDILNFTEKTGDAQRLINAFIKAQSVDPDINARDWALAARYSRSGGLALSDEFLGAILPTLIQDIGGAQVGTMLQQSIAQNIGNRIKKESKEYQTQAGLRDENGNFIGRDLLLSNPYRWTQQYLPGALQKLGLDPNNQSDLTEFASKAFSNTRVADLFTKLLSQKDQIERNIGLFNQAPGITAAEQLRNRDPLVASEGVLAQLRNLAAQLAEPILPGATAAMNAFSDSIAGFTKRLAANPLLNAAISGVAGVTGAAGIGATAWWLGSRYLPAGTGGFLGRLGGKALIPLSAYFRTRDTLTDIEELNEVYQRRGWLAAAPRAFEAISGVINPIASQGSIRRMVSGWLPQWSPETQPDSVRSPLRVGPDSPQLNLGPLPNLGNIPAKAEVSGSIDVKSNVDVKLDTNLLRAFITQTVEPLIKNIQINGATTGTTGPLGRTMGEAEFHP